VDVWFVMIGQQALLPLSVDGNMYESADAKVISRTTNRNFQNQEMRGLIVVVLFVLSSLKMLYLLSASQWQQKSFGPEVIFIQS
jgi:hypothetical protein